MKNTEDVYPILPMQELMLVHLFSAPESEALFEQVCYAIEGQLDASAYKRAWQEVVNRHPVLRTSFHVKGLKNPLQVVHQEVSLPWELHDWRELSSEDQERRLGEFLKADRQRGFVPSRAPVMRMALVQVAADKHYLVRSFHHVILDRWSWLLVSGEASKFYDGYVGGRELMLPRPRPYRDYVRWFLDQDLSSAEEYWRRTLEGVTPSATFAGVAGIGTERTPGQDTSVQQFDAETTAALQSMARRLRITLSTIVQGAWALLLGRYGDRNDVVFGATVSGRPAVLPGVETIAGLFINNLPVRVKLPADSPVEDWLKAFHEQQLEQRNYEYTPPPLIQECSGVDGGTSLFDSLVVFQSDRNEAVESPRDARGASGGPGLEIRTIRSGMRTIYPVTLTFVAGTGLVSLLTYDRHRFEADTISKMQEHLRSLLQEMSTGSAESIRRFQGRLDSVPDLAGPVAAPSATSLVDPTDDLDGDFIAPRSEAEIALAEVWQQVLGVDRVSVYDNFFDIGGTSVLLGQATIKFEVRTGVHLNPFDFGLHTLAQIAAGCETRIEKAETLPAAAAVGSKRGLSSLLGKLVRRNK